MKLGNLKEALISRAHLPRPALSCIYVTTEISVRNLAHKLGIHEGLVRRLAAKWVNLGVIREMELVGARTLKSKIMGALKEVAQKRMQWVMVFRRVIVKQDCGWH